MAGAASCTSLELSPSSKWPLAETTGCRKWDPSSRNRRSRNSDSWIRVDSWI